MTDLSGVEFNKTFRSNVQAGAPYYYISAHLDLSGMDTGETLYFNRDNSLAYKAKPDEYSKFITIDSSSVIGEVVVYANPDLTSEISTSVKNIKIGGAPSYTDSVSVVWAGQTGSTPGNISINDINNGVVCRYGHEGGHAVGDDEDNSIKFLAISIPPLVDELGLKASKKYPKRIKLSRALKQIEPTTIGSGTVYVVVKVFPKFQ